MIQFIAPKQQKTHNKIIQKIPPLENKSKLAIHKYRSKIIKHISTIESRINKKLKKISKKKSAVQDPGS